ncbi:MAG: hypothetical protein JSS24_09575 [Proteobacteria bacterium]|nr:hypothetical protein [Pseudomonadota bacterium]
MEPIETTFKPVLYAAQVCPQGFTRRFDAGNAVESGKTLVGARRQLCDPLVAAKDGTVCLQIIVVGLLEPVSDD